MKAAGKEENGKLQVPASPVEANDPGTNEVHGPLRLPLHFHGIYNYVMPA